MDRPPLGPRRPINADHVARDFAAEGKVGLSNRHLATAALVGPADRLFIHESARIDPYTVFDTTNGPITVAAGRLGPAVHPDRGPVLHRPRHPALPGQPPRRRDDRPELPDRRRGRGDDRPRLLEQVPRGVPRPRLRRRVGQPRRDHLQQRPPQRLRRGPRPARRRPGGRPARRRSAASSATTPGPAWGACSTPARRSA